MKSDNLIEMTGKIGAMLGAIAAGGATLISVAGFLVLRSHARLLGLSDALHHSFAEYVQEGGAFVLATVTWTVPVAVVRQLPEIIGLVVLCLFGWKVIADRKSLAWVRRIIPRRVEEVLKWCFLALLFGVALKGASELLPDRGSRDLLFKGVADEAVLKRTSDAGIKSLELRYVEGFLWLIASVAGTGSVVRYLFIRKRSIRRSLWLHVLLLVVAWQIVLLPAKYGELVYPTYFHHVEHIVWQEAGSELNNSGELWLVQESEGDVILYDSALRRVFLLQRGIVRALVLGRQSNPLSGTRKIVN